MAILESAVGCDSAITRQNAGSLASTGSRRASGRSTLPAAVALALMTVVFGSESLARSAHLAAPPDCWPDATDAAAKPSHTAIATRFMLPPLGAAILAA